MRSLLAALAIGLFACLATVQAEAQRGSAQMDARAEVAAALYAASATQAAAERAADARLRAAQAEIARLQAQGASANAHLVAAQETYVAELARRDHAYEQEIAVYRSAITDIASTSEGVAALARFNAGDEAGALTVLDQLVDARERARQTRANIDTAAEHRQVATLALEARARGRVDTGAVIERFEQVVRLDPNAFWDWIELTRLYRDAGQLAAAEAAARRAMGMAGELRERGVVLTDLADVLAVRGDLAAAAALHEQSLAISREIYDQTPGPGTRRDLSISVSRIADISLGIGDIEKAVQLYRESLALDQQSLSEASTLQNGRDVCVDVINLTDAVVALGDLPSALATIEFAVNYCGYIARNFGNGEDQLQLAYAHWRRANIRAAQGDLEFARREFLSLTTFANEALRADPTNARLSLEAQLLALGLADIAILDGNAYGARAQLEIFIANARQASDTLGLEEQANAYIWLAQVRLSTLPGSEYSWRTLQPLHASALALADLSALDWLFMRRSAEQLE